MGELADKNRQLAQNTYNQAHKMADIIPLGQPILIGHHSESRDRNYRDRIQNKFEKAHELSEKANYYASRAASAESNNAISSDNPDAVDLLKEKLADAERLQETMKAANKIIKSKKLTNAEKIQKVMQYGADHGVKTFQNENRIKDLLEKDFCGRIGFPDYAITNNGATIRSIKQRIEKLEREKTEVSKEYEIGDTQIVDSVEDNRVLIYFRGIPSEDIRDYLKACGFRWSPSNRAWQAYRTAAWKIPGIIKRLSAMPAYIPELYILSEGCQV